LSGDSRAGTQPSVTKYARRNSQPEVDPFEPLLLYSGDTSDERRDVEPLPDLPTLSDDDLRAMIHKLEKEEDEISFRRRVLHGRIDILRAELVARLREQVSAGEAQLADVERLSEILAAKAAPSTGGDE
jgi:anti-sigma-K factor RsiG